MDRNPRKAVAYYRTSSATNIGEGKDFRVRAGSGGAGLREAHAPHHRRRLR